MEAERSLVCAACGDELREESAVLVKSGSGRSERIVPLCANCAAEAERVFEEETKGANVGLAALVGLAAAVLATLVWYGAVVLTKYQLGIVAIGVGFLVGKAVVWGSGKKRGVPLQAISAGLTVLAMVFSEYFIVRYFVVQELAKEGLVNIPLFFPVGVMGEVILEGIKADPLTLLFWLIAVWQASSIPAPRRLRKVAG